MRGKASEGAEALGISWLCCGAGRGVRSARCRTQPPALLGAAGRPHGAARSRVERSCSHQTVRLDETRCKAPVGTQIGTRHCVQLRAWRWQLALS